MRFHVPCSGFSEPQCLLACSSPGEHVGVLDDHQLRWFSFSDFEDASPFGKRAAFFLVLEASLFQTVQALSRDLVGGAQQIDNALVHFDADLAKEM